MQIQKIKEWYAAVMGKKTSYERKGIKPAHDWKVLLTSSFAALVLLAFTAFYFYRQIDQGRLFSVTNENIQKEVRINLVLLNKTIEDVNKREASLKELRENPKNFPDPSL